MKTTKKLWFYPLVAVLFSAVITSCDDDEETPPPPQENEEEVITSVKLIFTDVDNPNDIVEASAIDPDGEGVEELEIQDEITLDVNKVYVLTYEILSALDPNDVEDIGEEIEEEDDEHQIFYGFSNDAFANPAGSGNIAPDAGAVNYNDEDSEAQDGSGNPVGLSTTWTTSVDPLMAGSFRVVLKHQPDGIKSATSTSDDGESDFDLEFILNIQ